MKKSELREWLTSRGAELATLDDVLEGSRILITINDNAKEDDILGWPGYALLFGYTIHRSRQDIEKDEKGWFNFQAHLDVECWINPETNRSRLVKTIVGHCNGTHLGNVYVIDRRYYGYKACFNHYSELIPNGLRMENKELLERIERDIENLKKG